jgi:hypothetical protein
LGEEEGRGDAAARLVSPRRLPAGDGAGLFFSAPSPKFLVQLYQTNKFSQMNIIYRASRKSPGVFR